MRFNKRDVGLTIAGGLVVAGAAYGANAAANAAPAPTAVSCELPQGLKPGTVNWLAGNILRIYSELPDNQRAEKDTPATPNKLATQTKVISIGSIATSKAAVSYRLPKTSNGQPSCVGLLESVSVSSTYGNTATVDTFTPDIKTLSWHDSETLYKDGESVGLKAYGNTGAEAPVFNQMLGSTERGFEAAVATDPILSAEGLLTADM